MNLYDIVRNINEIENVPSNSAGTIVMIHDKEKGVYEVEFVDESQETIAVVTAHRRDLKRS